MLLLLSCSLLTSREMLFNKSSFFILLLENNDLIYWFVTYSSASNSCRIDRCTCSALNLFPDVSWSLKYLYKIFLCFDEKQKFCHTWSAQSCSENWFKELVSLLLCWIELLSTNNGLSSFEDFFIRFVNDNLTLSMRDLTTEKLCCFESIFCSNCNWLSKTVLHPFSKQKWRLQNCHVALFFELLVETYLLALLVTLNGLTNFNLFLKVTGLYFHTTPWPMPKYLHMTIRVSWKSKEWWYCVIFGILSQLMCSFLLLMPQLLQNFSCHFHNAKQHRYPLHIVCHGQHLHSYLLKI